MKKSRTVTLVIILLVLTASLLPAAQTETAKPKKPFIPFVLNTLPGFGLGSFILGDPLGGLVALGGEVIGAGLFGYGLSYIIGAAVGVGIVEALTLGYADAEVDTTRGEVCILSGFSLWAGSRIFSMIRPFVFAARHNREAGLTGVVPEMRIRMTTGREGVTPRPVFWLRLE